MESIDVEDAAPHEETALRGDETLLVRYRSYARANPTAIAGIVMPLILVLIFGGGAHAIEGPARTMCIVVAIASAVGSLAAAYAHWHYNTHTLLTVTNQRIVFRGGWFGITEIELKVSAQMKIDWTRNAPHPLIAITTPEGVIHMRGVRQPDKLITLLRTLAGSGA